MWCCPTPSWAFAVLACWSRVPSPSPRNGTQTCRSAPTGRLGGSQTSVHAPLPRRYRNPHGDAEPADDLRRGHENLLFQAKVVGDVRSFNCTTVFSGLTEKRHVFYFRLECSRFTFPKAARISLQRGTKAATRHRPASLPWKKLIIYHQN